MTDEEFNSILNPKIPHLPHNIAPNLKYIPVLQQWLSKFQSGDRRGFSFRPVTQSPQTARERLREVANYIMKGKLPNSGIDESALKDMWPQFTLSSDKEQVHLRPKFQQFSPDFIPTSESQWTFEVPINANHPHLEQILDNLCSCISLNHNLFGKPLVIIVSDWLDTKAQIKLKLKFPSVLITENRHKPNQWIIG